MKDLTPRQQLDMNRLYNQVEENKLENQENCNICYIRIKKETRNVLAKKGYIKVIEACEEHNNTVDVVKVLK
jgi:ribosomal protein S8